MATPNGTQIAFSELNTEIMQRGAGSYCPITEPSDRLGYGGQRAISDLWKCYGAVVNCGTYTDKFGTTTGFSAYIPIGSMDNRTYVPGYLVDAIATGLGGLNYVYYNEAPGYDVINNLIRFALGNGARNISGQQNVPPEYFNFDGGGMPGSGTAAVGFRWQ